MRSPDAKDLFNLTAEMYESAAGSDAAGWLKVYETIAAMLSSGPGSIHFLDRAASKFEAIADTNEPGFIERFNDEYFPIHPSRKKIIHLRSGQDFIRSRDCPDRIYTNSDVYQEHLRPRGIYYVFHRCLYESSSTSIGITFTRPRPLRPFNRADLRLFSTVSEHLIRAIGLFVKMRKAAAGSRMAIAAWDRVPQGAVVLSLTGEIVFANLAAASHFESEDLRIARNGTLAFADNAANNKLRSMLNGMAKHTAAGATSFGGTIFLERENSLPLILSISPFDEQGVMGFAKKYALLLITDPLSEASASESFLRVNYRLTAAEIRLALSLAQGNSLKEAAEQLGITHNTARTHLKRIFGKTSVNRQSSLVRLILDGETRLQDR